MKVSFPYFPK
ncbi:Protein CBG25282 [Caenorhabditis briggsae]|uniref:Protein CBG25282 n=1 Tax=Caenorhabditis briggsae TaxID=6238 RepID=B6IIK0_CAEBR|nr:Protein CBG25282 [Caenorhabditis briggsae]CAR99730.1 Protein CBG25282 [Caenorhabditis briggsae]